ncbi:MAG: 50S ribosomal protein L29 [Deltaproteobacteria bacterium]|nr:50S ribosomal protein L29 [Deltaproteobacteria bacterium]
MKTGEIREMTGDELSRREMDLKKELFVLKVQNASGQAENPIRIRHIRRDIARVKTIARQKDKKAGS